jgi:DeoR/GlpR family transcriptional regulator of sugar metabolism
VRYAGAPQRRAELLRRLTAAGYVSCGELAAAMGVSDMTIRRDLRLLEDAGRVRRVMGGASLPEPGRTFEDRRDHRAAAKRALARAAGALLDDASVVALDAGTTVAAAAREVPAGCTVVTHSLPVMAECARRDDVELIALGGSYLRGTGSCGGATTRAAVAGLAIDVVLLGAAGYDERGLYSRNVLDAEVKQALLAAAGRAVVLVDASKAGLRAPIRFARLAEVAVVVTDAAPGWLADEVGEVLVVGEVAVS